MSSMFLRIQRGRTVEYPDNGRVLHHGERGQKEDKALGNRQKRKVYDKFSHFLVREERSVKEGNGSSI